MSQVNMKLLLQCNSNFTRYFSECDFANSDNTQWVVSLWCFNSDDNFTTYSWIICQCSWQL